MLFSSIPFLFYYLPIVLIAYFLMPKAGRNGLLLAASLLFYAWGEPRYVVLMVATILAFYGFGLAIQHSRRKKLWLTLSVVTGLAALAVFKYANFAVENFNALTGLSVPALKLALPIGISFYTFQCISYAVDVYRGDAKAQKNVIHFGAYVALFPQLIAGPIVRYVEVERALEDRKTTWEDFTEGLFGFLVGLGKKILLANQFGALTEVFRASGEKSVLFFWLYGIAFALHIYFDFSGYSDMAVGLGRIFGFRFPRNFNYPYISRSVTEFWRRWHMTLSQWFRDYVYIPMGGNRVGKGRWVINILTVWMLTGLWHGAAWNFVAWGLLFAVLLLVEKWVPFLTRLPGFLRHIYVSLIVIVSFMIFNASSLVQAAGDLGGLLGIGGYPLYSAEAVYYLRSYLPLLIAGCIGATPLLRNAAIRLSKRVTAAPLLRLAVATVLLLVCTAYLVDGSFNPFLYFRF